MFWKEEEDKTEKEGESEETNKTDEKDQIEPTERNEKENVRIIYLRAMPCFHYVIVWCKLQLLQCRSISDTI